MMRNSIGKTATFLFVLVSAMFSIEVLASNSHFQFDLQALKKASIFYGTIISIEGTQNSKLYWHKGNSTIPVTVVPVLNTISKNTLELSFKGCLENCDDTKKTKIEDVFQFPVNLDSDGKISVLYSSLNVLGPLFKQEFYKYSGLGNLPEFSISRVVSRNAFWEKQKADKRPWLIFDSDIYIKPLDPAFGVDVKLTVRWVLRTLPDLKDFKIVEEKAPTIQTMRTYRSLKYNVAHWNFIKNGPIDLYILHAESDIHKEAVREASRRWNAIGQMVLHTDLIHPIFVSPKEEKAKGIVAGDPRYSVYSFVDEPFGTCVGLAKATPVSGVILQAVGFCGKSWMNVDKSDVGDGYRFYLENVLKSGSHSGSVAAKPNYFDDDISIPNYDYTLRYVSNLLTHEFGHLLGIDHNYLGSVFESGTDRAGREKTPNNKVGAYDKMTIAYSVLGDKPLHPEWGCSREETDKTDKLRYNPECSFMDETRDSFGYLISRLRRTLHWMSLPGTNYRPVWNWDLASKSFVVSQVTDALKYGLVTQEVANSFRTFGQFSGRPTQQPFLRDYVINQVSKVLCDPLWERAIEEKTSSVVKALIYEEIYKARKAISKLATELGYSVDESATLTCGKK